jgi:hypothetical protein
MAYVARFLELVFCIILQIFGWEDIFGGNHHLGGTAKTTPKFIYLEVLQKLKQ